MPDIFDLKENEQQLFERFQEHNTFTIEHGILTNTFPKFAKKDSNSSPDSKDQIILYKLESGDASRLQSPAGAK